jgi:hypothetical protein
MKLINGLKKKHTRDVINIAVGFLLYAKREMRNHSDSFLSLLRLRIAGKYFLRIRPVVGVLPSLSFI